MNTGCAGPKLIQYPKITRVMNAYEIGLTAEGQSLAVWREAR
jgi:hypothetical protein